MKNLKNNNLIKRKILVIKLGAMGDFIMATGAFADIRAYEKDAEITLLTTNGMLALTKNSPFFDKVEVIQRLPLWRLDYLYKIYSFFHKDGGFDMVYDLQNNQRTSWFYRLSGKPSWSGVAKGCSHPHKDKNRGKLHSFEMARGQILDAGIDSKHNIDVSYAGEELPKEITETLARADNNENKKPLAVICAGCAPTRPLKRWSAENYAKLITQLEDKFTAVLVGTQAEAEILTEIEKSSSVINLCDKLNLNQLIELFKSAQLVIGNDTGPMHLAAASGLSGVVIFGEDSNPTNSRPASDKIKVIATDGNINDITVEEVLAKING